jgi:hypothetical protein
VGGVRGLAIWLVLSFYLIMEALKKMSWQERVRLLAKYKEEYDLSLRSLADEFDYSLGKMHYEITLAAALPIFPELEKISKVTEAIKFIKMKGFKVEDVENSDDS